MNYTWQNFIEAEQGKDYFLKIMSEIDSQIKNGIEIYPAKENIFKAFNSTEFENIIVVIIGQDPYHNVGQANGLCFSVPATTKIPPSLVNIFKELVADCNIKMPTHGNLEMWAKQGVFLLNSILTVQAHAPASHNKIGWQQFTDNAISTISANLNGVVFLLWGNYAQQKAALINTEKHHILKAAHPSPFSVYRGFAGCKHFSVTNKILAQHGKQEIDWSI